MATFKFNDGGRKVAGYTKQTGDCATRAIAIATGLPYQKVWDDLTTLMIPVKKSYSKKWLGKNISERARKKLLKPHNADHGCPKVISKKYLQSLGWEWVATMHIGSGCKVHLRADELPSGVIICSVSKHLVTVIDGVINDTGNCSRNGTRCVYGYFIKRSTEPLKSDKTEDEYFRSIGWVGL